MEKSSVSEENFKLWTVLSQTRDALYKVRERELEQYGTTPVKAGVLEVIKRLGGRSTTNEIARYMFREANTISTLMIRLEKQGLVKRTRTGGSRSLTYITLTEKGEKLYKDTLKRESIDGVLSCLSQDERRQLYQMLEKVRDDAFGRLATDFEFPFP